MLVAIDGFGASGKSSFAHALADRHDGVVVSLDAFARPGTPTWEHDRFVDEVLTPLRAGRPATYHRWPPDAPAPVATATVPPRGLVLVEGVSVLALAVVERLGVWWDLSLWLDVPEPVRRRRIARRDGERLAGRWAREWWPSEQRYAADERPLDRVDLVVRDAGAPPSGCDGPVGGAR